MASRHVMPSRPYISRAHCCGRLGWQAGPSYARVKFATRGHCQSNYSCQALGLEPCYRPSHLRPSIEPGHASIGRFPLRYAMKAKTGPRPRTATRRTTSRQFTYTTSSALIPAILCATFFHRHCLPDATDSVAPPLSSRSLPCARGQMHSVCPRPIHRHR